LSDILLAVRRAQCNNSRLPDSKSPSDKHVC
jgi:hypothetical protein